MLKSFLLLSVLVLSGCSSVQERPEKPSHIEEITLENGKVIQVYHKGYDREDFLKEFYGYSKE